MWVREICRRLCHPLVLFGATAAVLLGTLTWLAWHILQQDRALVDQRIQERLDSTADLALTALQDTFSSVEERLADVAESSDPNLAEAIGLNGVKINQAALIVRVEPGMVKAHPPANLRYYPVLPPSATSRTDVFTAGEVQEFQRQDYTRAASVYQKLASSTDDAIRNGALARLGRVLRKANDPNGALDVYAKLAESGTDTVDGLPAELLARHARCVVLHELKRMPELNQEARSLWSGLQQARWPLLSSRYHFYEREVRRWLDPSRPTAQAGTVQPDGGETLAAAVEELWRLWQRVRQGDVAPSGQRSLWIAGAPVLLMWQGTQDRLAALVALPDYVEKAWLAPVVQRMAGQQAVRFALADTEGHSFWGHWKQQPAQQALRTSLQPGWPWTLQVTSGDPSLFMAEIKTRRRLLWGGLVTMGALVVAAGYAIVRSVTRELKVARLQGDFVSAVSHEFRTPLASLCHLSDLLVQGRVATEQRRREYYQALQRESERLHRLVENILDFRRMEVGAREYQLEPVDATTLIRGTAEAFAQEVQERGCVVEIEVEDALPQIRADREALGRAIRNLLDNAVKYSPDCQTVWIQASRTGDGVVVSVRDQGLGIARSEQELIFEKFYRAEDAKRSGARGTGLGLTMVQHVVTAHGGQLQVNSQLGEGSVFTIHLPFIGDGA